MILTIYDVAKKAGVSPATVSRVINKYPFISAPVRQRVQEVIKETGFVPNPYAQKMRLGIGTRDADDTVAAAI
jgi:LacI family transcriptional regulator